MGDAWDEGERSLMPMRVVTGAPFSGKTQAVERALRRGDVVLDTTRAWRSFAYDWEEQDERSDSDGRIANAMKRRGLEVAVEEGRDGYVIIAERDRQRIEKWLDAADQAKALLVREPMDELRKRARRRGPTCEALLEKWDGYEDDPELAAVTEPWDPEARTMRHLEMVQYRAACEAATLHYARREAVNGIECRALVEDAELRADMDKREISGVLVRYGDEARIYGMRERIARGAFTIRGGPENVNIQHRRELPIGRADGSYIDDEDAMRFKFPVADTARGRAMLEEVAAGLWRGASVEMRPGKHRMLEAGGDDGPLIEIMQADLLRYGIVDNGAYPDSKIMMRSREPEPEPEPAEPSRDLIHRVSLYLGNHGEGVSVRQARRDIVGRAADIDAALREVGVKDCDGRWRVRTLDTPVSRVGHSRHLMVV